MLRLSRHPNVEVLDHFERWLMVERGLQPTTIRGYLSTLRKVAESTSKPLVKLSTKDLRRFLFDSGGKPSSIASHLAAMRSLYGFLVRSGRRSDDPTVQLSRPKVHRGIPRPVAELVAKLALLEPRARWVALFLVETGLRISEACGLDEALPIRDVLVIRGKGAKERVVPLSPLAIKALTALEGHMGWGPRAIQRKFKAVGFKPHALRHTFACRLSDADVDLSVIQDLLGHASPATTRVYMANREARLRAGVAKLEPIGA